MVGSIFLLITLLTLYLIYLATGKNKKLILLFVVWQVVIGCMAIAGTFIIRPNLFPIIMGCTILLTFFCFRKVDEQKLNLVFLLSIHVLRFPVEIILYVLYLQQKVPDLMTFSGWNFDILIGISALMLLLYVFFSRRKLNKHFFLIWNVTGIAFLLFIVSLAVLSSPLPIQQLAFDQPNVAVLEFPYCFLPTCVVPIVLLSHLLLICKWRKLDVGI